MHVLDVLKAVDELGHVVAANGQANNRHDTESMGGASPSPSTTLVSRSHGRRATASPSTSAAPIIKGRGRRATTPRVVTSSRILAPIPYASP